MDDDSDEKANDGAAPLPPPTSLLYHHDGVVREQDAAAKTNRSTWTDPRLILSRKFKTFSDHDSKNKNEGEPGKKHAGAAKPRMNGKMNSFTKYLKTVK